MLNKLKKVIKQNTIDSSHNVSIKPKVENSAFAGYTKAQMKHQIENAKNNDSLSVAKLGDEAIEALAKYKTQNDMPNNIDPNMPLMESIAMSYSYGENEKIIEKLKSHLNENKGNVDKRYWYMLLDLYQINQDQKNFMITAIAFSKFFNTSPPSWKEKNQTPKPIMSGKNILILNSQLKEEDFDNFQVFFKYAKHEKFCRINISACDFNKIDFNSLKKLYQLFTKLKKYHIATILMGEGKLVEYCKKNMYEHSFDEIVPTHKNRLFWLIYFEILQWKGKKTEFENFALEYAQKFEISPPGWDNTYNIGIETQTENSISNVILDTELNSNTLPQLLHFIEEDHKSDPISNYEINFDQISRVSFSAANEMSHFIQELWSNNKHKEIIFKYPNELVLTLLEMTGVTEFVQIIPTHR